MAQSKYPIVWFQEEENVDDGQNRVKQSRRGCSLSPAMILPH